MDKVYQFVTKEEFEQFKAAWEIEIDKGQDDVNHPYCVDEQAYYELVAIAERLLAEREAFREVAKKKAETVAVFANPLVPCWTEESLYQGAAAVARRLLEKK